MFTKKAYINSYYGEDDSGVTDGFYIVEYETKYNLEEEIKKAYNDMNEDMDLVRDLGEVLERLFSDKKILSYEGTEKLLQFDCDYGIFKEV